MCVCGYEDVVGVHSNVLSAQNRMQESRFMCDVQLGYVVMYMRFGECKKGRKTIKNVMKICNDYTCLFKRK